MNNLNGNNWREKFRVRIGFAFGILFIWRAQPRFAPFLILGLLVGLAGILIRQWAAGCVKKMDEVAKTGPYALVRHPLYLGSFLAAAGLILASTTLHTLGLSRPFLDRSLFFWAVLWILIDSIYMPKIQQEEENLKNKFGDEYIRYSDTVPQIFPKEIKKQSFDFSTFDIELWKKNKEYWSLVGFSLIALVLLGRFFIR